ncbi:hypothetical protein AB1N83_004996, partial [Pleurotus pulmonarius]
NQRLRTPSSQRATCLWQVKFSRGHPEISQRTANHWRAALVFD